MSTTGTQQREAVARESASLPLVVNCARAAREGGFYEPHLRGRLRWLQVAAGEYGGPRGRGWGRLWPGSSSLWQRWSGCRAAARVAKAEGAALFVSHDPRVTFASQLCLERAGYGGPHLAYAFNYAELPTGIKAGLHRRGLERVDKFVVYSTLERRLYHERLGIPEEKLEFVHWGVGAPALESGAGPVVDGEYVCAIGGNGRDYRTLVEAVRGLPEVRLVIVARPENLAGIELPDNVEARVNVPLAEAINVLAFSRFLAVPLAGSKVPCGHVTLVNAMHLGRAVAITRSAGVADYVKEGETGATFAAGSVGEMREVLGGLWRDEGLCERLGEGGRRFAREHCTEERSLSRFVEVVRSLGVGVGGTEVWAS